jgi:hypothetical protein
MANSWDTYSLEREISINIDRLSRSIQSINNASSSNSDPIRELSTLFGRLKANMALNNSGCILSKNQFLNQLGEMRNCIPDKLRVEQNRKHFELGWKCEIEILKSMANRLS